MFKNFLTPLLCLEDNFIYILEYEDNAIVIDPTEALPVIEHLDKKKLTLQAIFCTHHHLDHVGGVPLLKKQYQAKVYGPQDERVPCLDEPIQEGEEYILGSFCFQGMQTPGHTKTHIALYENNHKILFSGDTLFGAGCGKIFEGTTEMMYHSLQKLAKLDEDTFIFFGHEYTLKNLQFAHKILPEDSSISKRLQATIQLRKNCQFTIPSTIKEEKRTNLFLRANDPILKKKLNMEQQPEVNVFAKLRELKDNF